VAAVRRVALALAALVVGWLGASTPAQAHRPGLSYATVSAHEVVLAFSRTELHRSMRAGLDRSLASVTAQRLFLRADGTPCDLGSPQVREVANDGVEVAVPVVSCPTADVWSLEVGYLSDFDEAHRVLVEAHGEPVGVLHGTSRVATFRSGPDSAAVAASMLVLGVEHILVGWDHLAFLFGLLLVAGSMRQVGGIVTGFTVGHSITLGAAALGLLRVSPDLVEPAIALSIAWVGAENFWQPPARRRFVLTFLLGLVHGFGFAGALTGLGVSTSSVVVGLVSFNLGVEVGQGAAVLVVLPVLWWLGRNKAWASRVRRVGSSSLVVGGGWLFVVRVAEVGGLAS